MKEHFLWLLNGVVACATAVFLSTHFAFPPQWTGNSQNSEGTAAMRLSPHLIFVTYPNSLSGEGGVSLNDTAVSLRMYPLTDEGLLPASGQPVSL